MLITKEGLILLSAKIILARSLGSRLVARLCGQSMAVKTSINITQLSSGWERGLKHSDKCISLFREVGISREVGIG